MTAHSRAEADGRAGAQLPGAAGLLDSYHACEHPAACGRRLYGEGAAEARAWLDRTRAALLVGGWLALAERAAALRRQVRSPGKRRGLDELEGYFGFGRKLNRVPTWECKSGLFSHPGGLAKANIAVSPAPFPDPLYRCLPAEPSVTSSFNLIEGFPSCA